MTSEFSTARAHLERAYECLQGQDETSKQTRAALDLLIEALIVAEHKKPTGRVVAFPRSPIRA